MAQTALEWFINGLLESNYITKDSSVMNEFIEQAKAMEKEQIINACNAFADYPFTEDDSKEYYNETYNK